MKMMGREVLDGEVLQGEREVGWRDDGDLLDGDTGLQSWSGRSTGMLDGEMFESINEMVTLDGEVLEMLDEDDGDVGWEDSAEWGRGQMETPDGGIGWRCWMRTLDGNNGWTGTLGRDGWRQWTGK